MPSSKCSTRALSCESWAVGVTHHLTELISTRPEVRYDYAYSARPFDNGTRRGQVMFAIDTILRFYASLCHGEAESASFHALKFWALDGHPKRRREPSRVISTRGVKQLVARRASIPSCQFKSDPRNHGR
jgi:hypothetical protein